jgi:sodium-dependent dicarboxylate transporter 2/3/5
MLHLVTRQNLGLVFGPILFVSMLLMPLPADMSPAALKVAAVACLMAIWWVSEAAS